MGLVMGVGGGLFFLAFLGVLAIALSVAASRTRLYRTVVCTCFALYIGITLCLLLTPRGDTGQQVSEIGYDNLGIFRIAVLVTMSTAAVGGVSMVAADKLLTVHIARSIEFGKDVLRHR